MKKLSVLLLLLAANPVSAQTDVPKKPLYMEGAIEGTLTPEDIRTGLLGKLDQLRYCYQKELERDVNLKDEATIIFSINRNTGKTYGIKTEGVDKVEMRLCLEDVIRKIKYYRYTQGPDIDVRQPINFKSVNIDLVK